MGSRGNIIGSEPFGPNMKEIDDTPLPESENELTDDAIKIAFIQINDRIRALEVLVEDLVEELEKRISNLEVQRTPADNNLDDPEWY